MVKICPTTYSKEDDEKYQEHFSVFPFPLSAFQKHAIEAIVEGHHTLVCAATGSGKTLPSEFAIQYFVGKGKKVIYTSPIKALSNQKYYDFSKQYPHISFGLLTGDVKVNPEADVIIMTAEILQNTLYRKRHGLASEALLLFNMDFDNELACVVHDEVHSINDPERGHVWESILMLLPAHVQNVMLSATLDSPERFASWCENNGSGTKQVYLTTLKQRVVPLIHYSFLCSTNSIFKAIKDKELEKQIREVIGKLFVLQNDKGVFQDACYLTMKKMTSLFDQKQVYMKRSFVLNQACTYMVQNNLLPAVCFILSRKQIEIAAKEITVPLLEDDSKVGYTIKKECEQILRAKIPNFKEYMELPEYVTMVSLLEKGIATHHSGTLPILKEIVELLFAKGYIKLLFATETFSCGLNMPIKTTLFTDVNKFDGTNNRVLYSHEYTQMAGRAGRRGIDTVGHVIHLNNLFKPIDMTEYKKMMSGKPQKLVSKFKISYHLVLNLMASSDGTDFVKNSMIQQDIEAEIKEYEIMEAKLREDLEKHSLDHIISPKESVARYNECLHEVHFLVNKKKKDMEKEIKELEEQYPSIKDDLSMLKMYNVIDVDYRELLYQKMCSEQFLDREVQVVSDFLEKDDFIDVKTKKPTLKGILASGLREVHCLTFAKLLEEGDLDKLSTNQLVAMFSCFTNVTVSEDLQTIKVPVMMKKVVDLYEYYQDFESTTQVSTGENYTIHYDLMEYTARWCSAETAEECKLVLQTLEQEKTIFLGEFIKAILKINNISSEMEKMAEHLGNMSLLEKLKEIPLKTLKFVATNQSLYI
jgi:superfamily II RNA helicase